MKKTKQEKLTYERRNFWKEANPEEQKKAMAYAIPYIEFLNKAKTERETIAYTLDILKNNKFTPFGKKGSRKVYSVFHNKTMAMAVIGTEPISRGFNMIAAHIDSPRVDLKQNPLYEDSNSALSCMRTHYYGGIKKYQWVSTPLALHGVIIKNDGSVLHISIGEKDDEPVFVIPDLLPHLAGKEQYTKNLADAIEAGKMNLVFSGMQEPGNDKKEAIKEYALKRLNEKYGISEADFQSAELQLVPAFKARHSGFDNSLVIGYGQDDRICAYNALMALTDNLSQKPKRTMVVYFSDKEEVGSQGNTGAQSIFIQDFISDLLAHNNEDNSSVNSVSYTHLTLPTIYSV